MKPFALVVICLLGSALMPPRSAATEPRVESVRFSDAGPVSELAELTRRDAVLKGDVRENPRYVRPFRVATERFRVRFPAGWDNAKPAGLIVWVSYDGGADVPAWWGSALDAEGLIVVGAEKAGNGRVRWERYQLALAAAHAATERWRIDPARIYAAGFSGGGRAASWLSTHYPDVFRGGLMIGGANPADGRKMARPAPEYAEFARKACRYVFLTGADDSNLAGARASASALRRAGYQRVTELEIPKHAHRLPSGKWLSKALRALDPD